MVGRSAGSAALSGFASLGLRIVRDLALAKLGHLATQWWTQHADGSPPDAAASQSADVEP